MRVSGLAKVSAGAVAVLCAVAGLAVAGQTSPSPEATFVPIQESGSLTVSFAGSRADGCAAHGLCDVRGRITLLPNRRGTLVVPRGGVYLLFGGGPTLRATVRVQRIQNGGVLGTCTAGGEIDGEPRATVSGSTATVSISTSNDALLSTDCAGPLERDIGGALRRVRLPFSRLFAGHGRISLAATARFASGGLAGVARSTIVLGLGRPRNDYPPSESGTTTTGAGITERVLTQHLRLTGVSGGFSGRFIDRPGCQFSDACAARGSFRLRPRYSVVSAMIEAGGDAATFSKSRLRAVLEGGGVPKGVHLLGDVTFSRAGSVSSSITQDGLTCSATVDAGYGAIDFGTPNDDTSIVDGPTRSRCPGPDLTIDATTTITEASLRGRTLTVRIIKPNVIDSIYNVTTHGTVTLRLARGALSQRLFPGAG